MANRTSDRSSGHRQGLRVSKSAVTKQDRPPVSSRRSARVAPSRAVLGQPPWMKIPEPSTRTLKVYALDPSAGNYVGNVMSVRIRWERNLKPGPVGTPLRRHRLRRGQSSAITRRSTSTTTGSSRAAASTRRNRIRASISRWSTRSLPKRSRSSRRRSAERSIGGAPTAPWPSRKAPASTPMPIASSTTSGC